MSSLFDDLKEGLQEVIDYEKGIGKATKATYRIEPVKKFSCKEIKAIRNKAGMTQTVFANYLGVSNKTIEAWELGRTHPTGPACRLLDILDSGNENNLTFIKRIK